MYLCHLVESKVVDGVIYCYSSKTKQQKEKALAVGSTHNIIQVTFYSLAENDQSCFLLRTITVSDYG